MNLLPAGTILQNRYQVLSQLGQGGMGAVYLARDRRLDKPCAVKETLDVSPQAQQQLRREAHLLARLNHAHLPRVTDYFAQTGRYYLVMDYVDGLDLDTWVQQCGPVPAAQALAWIDQVLDALDYLHGQSPPIIHRDVKPANIKVTPGGQVFLVDFGIAKEYRPGQYTRTGARAGTPGYAPLEQYAASGQTDARTDVYGLGATLYYLLAGVPPLDALDRAAGGRLPSLREANPYVQVSRGVEGVVWKALELQKQDRWSSAGEMRRALAQTDRPTQAQTPAPRPARHPGPGPIAARSRHEGSVPVLNSRTLLLLMGSVAAVLVIALGLLALATGWIGAPNRQASPTATPQKVSISVPGTPAPGAVPTAGLAPTSANEETIRTAQVIAEISATAMTVETPRPLPTASLTPEPPRGEGTATLIPTPELPTRVAATLTPTAELPTSTPTHPPPTRTPRVSPAATATLRPTAQPRYPAPTLVAPENNASFQKKGHFAWQYTGPPLQSDQAFDVRIWSKQYEQDIVRGQRRGATAPTGNTEVEIDLAGVPAIQQYGGGDYYWTVVIVQLPDCYPQCPLTIIGEWGEERVFVYTPPGPPPEKPTATPGH